MRMKSLDVTVGCPAMREWVRTDASVRRNASDRSHKKTPTDSGEGLGVRPLAVTYSCMAKPHYHRRMRVSLLSSGWDQVVPRRYGRQGRGGNSA
jgi:hypothetical protein